MQRAWANRLKFILKIALPILVIGLCILFDQLTKNYFKTEYSTYEKNFIIPNFFYFTYTVNTGAAWSFLADKAWGQIFFKILTGFALGGFVVFLVYAIKKDWKWVSYSLALIIGGTIGNFIDRLFFGGVTDFIGFIFGDYSFPIFNLADSFLVIGLILLIFYFCFLDEHALFKPSKKKFGENSDAKNNEQSDATTDETTTNVEEKEEDGKENISDK